MIIKNMKVRLATVFLALITLGGFLFPSALLVSANEISGTDVKVIKNDTMLALERKLNTPAMRIALSSEEIDEEVVFNYFVEKFDGAEVQHIIGRNVAVTETFHVGGYNVFASNRSGLEYARTQLANSATLLLANGTLGGALLGGPAGALIGLLGSSILASRFRSGSEIMRSWINVGSNRGGARMTLSEVFAISTLNTTSQSPIRPF
jgi:hypothetical protein